MEFDDNLNPITPDNEPKPSQPEPTPIPQPMAQTRTDLPPRMPSPTPRYSWASPMLLIVVVLLLVAGGTLFAMQKKGMMGGTNNPYTNPNGQMEGLNVSAEGLVYATPDIAKLSVGVQEIGRDTTVVQANVAKKIDAIKAKLKELEIEDKDIKTVEFGIYPDYGNYPLTSTSKPRSYTGRHILEVTIRNLDNANKVAGVVVAAGANEVQNVYFTVEDPDSWYQQARTQAITKAKEKAKQLASDADIKLGRLISISENSYGGPIMYDRAMPAYGGMGGGEVKTGLEPGNLEIRANVTLIYQIR